MTSVVSRVAIEVEHAKHTNPIPLGCMVMVPAGITRFFTSGAIYGQGMDSTLPPSAEQQTKNVIYNLVAALALAGLSPRNLVMLKFMANSQGTLKLVKEELKKAYPQLCQTGYPAGDGVDHRISRSTKVDAELSETWPDRLVYCEAMAVG